MCVGEILIIVGARPQFVKAAMVARALDAAGVHPVLLHAGQHYGVAMGDRFLEELSLPPPAYHLGVGSGSHGEQTARMLTGIEAAIQQASYMWVVVLGDTNSTLAGALAAVKMHVPVAHVEAGLRSFNRRMPEEINRILTDQASDLLFAPTETAVAHLRREGVAASHIVLAGDVMFDAALQFADHDGRRLGQLRAAYGLDAAEPYVLATVHRAENTDVRPRLKAVMAGLGRVASQMPVVLPLHPRTRSAMRRLGLTPDPNINVVEPTGYLDFLALAAGAAVVATDSGGVQKEAFFVRTPCVTLRDETEWVELVEHGWNRLAPPRTATAVAEQIFAAVGRHGEPVALYGDGRAGERIAQHLLA